MKDSINYHFLFLAFLFFPILTNIFLLVTLRQAWKGSWSSLPLMTMLGKSSRWTSRGSSIPFRVTMICLGCSSTGRERIRAATSSAVFHLASYNREPHSYIKVMTTSTAVIVFTNKINIFCIKSMLQFYINGFCPFKAYGPWHFLINLYISCILGSNQPS